MVSLCWGVCKASRWRHHATVPAHRHACARNTVTLQLQDGGYALLWKRYNNNNMAAITVAVADVFYIFNSTVVDWTCFFFFFLFSLKVPTGYINNSERVYKWDSVLGSE